MIRRDGDFVPVLYDTKTGTVVAGLVPPGPNLSNMSVVRRIAASCSVLIATVSLPASALAAASLTWLGMSIGEPVTQARAQFGDPLLVRPLGNARVASYLREDDPAAAINVTEERGVVLAIEYLRERAEQTAGLADPFGVRLGAKIDDVRKMRGKPSIDTGDALYYPIDPEQHATVIYHFDEGILASIKLIGSPANAAGNDALPHIAEAKGDSYADAVLDASSKPGASIHFRERYFAVHSCDAAGRSTTTEKRTGKTYAVMSGICDGKKRAVYFDISRSAQ
jgi:hypothetical protein